MTNASPAYTPKTLHTAQHLLDLLLMWNAKMPERVSVKHKVRGQWVDDTWAQVTTRIRKLSLGLTALGIAPGDRVAIFSQSRYEWTLAQFAIYGAGGVVVPIYSSNTPAEVEYILRDSGAKAAFVDHDDGEAKLPGRFTRIKQVRANCPDLKAVFGFDLPSRPDESLVSFADLEAKGAQALTSNPTALEQRAATMTADDLSFIVYTSGTTGRPKGVMLTQANWTSQCKGIHDIDLVGHDHLVLLFLPLAHVFAMVVTAGWLGDGLTVGYAESIERAVDNSAEIHATCLVAVPRVFEKAYNKIVTEGAAAPGVKGRLFVWAMGLFEEYVAARAAGREYNNVQWALAKRLVFTKIQAKLDARFGGKAHKFISGGAPLSRKLGYFFDLVGFQILEGYGLTETAAPTHVNRPKRNRIGTVGEPFPGVQVKIAEDGEVLIRGPQIMKGYWKQDEDTKAVFEDGWFRTGDIGQVDADGYLRITDRKKDMIKTSGGKFIAPQELEHGVKAEPLISQVLIVGDKRKFVSALITLNEENVRAYARQRGLPEGASFAELTRHPDVRVRVQAAVDAVNAVQPGYATIKKFAILDHDWALDTGEITASLKVKRKLVTEKYRQILDGFYEGERFE